MIFMKTMKKISTIMTAFVLTAGFAFADNAGEDNWDFMISSGVALPFIQHSIDTDNEPGLEDYTLKTFGVGYKGQFSATEKSSGLTFLVSTTVAALKTDDLLNTTKNEFGGYANIYIGIGSAIVNNDNVSFILTGGFGGEGTYFETKRTSGSDKYKSMTCTGAIFAGADANLTLKLSKHFGLTFGVAGECEIFGAQGYDPDHKYDDKNDDDDYDFNDAEYNFSVNPGKFNVIPSIGFSVLF